MAEQVLQRLANSEYGGERPHFTGRPGLQRKPILVADTTVALASEVIAKPVDRERFYQVIGEHLGVERPVVDQFPGEAERLHAHPLDGRPVPATLTIPYRFVLL